MSCGDKAVFDNGSPKLREQERGRRSLAELTDAEMRAQGRHKSAKVLPRYAKRTMRQVAKGIQKRHAERTKSGQTSVMSNSSSSVIED